MCGSLYPSGLPYRSDPPSDHMHSAISNSKANQGFEGFIEESPEDYTPMASSNNSSFVWGTRAARATERDLAALLPEKGGTAQARVSTVLALPLLTSNVRQANIQIEK